VLDGGEKEVFLGGSRLNKFMETVESATSAIPEELLEDSEDALRSPPEPEADGQPQGRRRPRKAPVEPEPEEETPPAPAVAAPADPWGALLQAGMALLHQFVGGAKPAAPAPGGPVKAAVGSLVTRDERTGETYLKVPVPAPEVLDQALRAFGTLLESLRK